MNAASGTMLTANQDAKRSAQRVAVRMQPGRNSSAHRLLMRAASDLVVRVWSHYLRAALDRAVQPARRTGPVR